MKRRHLLLMALSLILSICMCFGLAACSSCDDDDDAPAKLSTPVVTIDVNTGVASWLEVENASGYAYVIADGAETATTKLSVQLTDGQTIKVKAKGDGTNYSDSDFSEEQTYTAPSAQPVQLSAPEVTIGDDGTVTIGTVANATKIVYVIGDGAETDYDASNKPVLAEGQTIKVKAKGDGTNYSDSAEVTKTRPASAPASVMTHAEFMGAEKDDAVIVQGVVTIISGKNVYFSDNDGGYYAYGVTEIPESLAVGMTVKVTGKKDFYYGVNQVGTGGTLEIVDTEIKDASPVDITEAVTNMTSLDELGAYQNMLVIIKGITLTEFNGNNFTFTLGTVEVSHYVGGKYQLVAQDDQNAYKQLFADNAGNTADLTCVVGATTKKDGDNTITVHQLVPASKTPLSNIQSSLTKLTAPTVSVDQTTGIATFVKSDGVSYVYKIGENGTVTDVPENGEIQLTAGDTVYVMAKGDGTTTADSDWSVGKTYSNVDPDTLPALDAPTVSVDANGNVTWTEVTGAAGYKYVIGDGEAQETSATSITAPLTAGQTVQVKALGDMVNNKDSEYASKTYVKKLPNPTVEISLSGVVTVTADSNATKVVYVIGDGTETDYDAENKPVLTNGQTIKVTAKGDGEAYSDSAVVEKTFTEIEVITYAEYMSSDTAVGTTVAVTGVVTAFRGKNIYFQDTDGGYYAYNATTVPANLEVGMTIKVVGAKAENKGLTQINTATIEITDETVTPVEPIDITTVNITALAELEAYQNRLVVIKGITVAAFSSSYTIKIGDVDVPVYVGGNSQIVDNNGQADFKKAFNDNIGKTGDLTCFVSIYNAAQLVPANTTPLSNLQGAAVCADPVVTIDDDGLATWAAVAGAVKYVYKVNDGTAVEITDITDKEEFSVQLSNNDYIVVQAIGDGTAYTESGWSAKKTYRQFNVTVGTFVKATATTTLKAGDVIAITNSDGKQTLKLGEKENNRDQTDFDVKTPSSDVMLVILEEGSKANTFRMRTKLGYLYAASSSSNYLKLKEDPDEDCDWEITIASTGVATITCKGQFERNLLRYNSSSKIFSCYGSGQNDVCVYVNVIATKLPTPAISIDADGFVTITNYDDITDKTDKIWYHVGNDEDAHDGDLAYDPANKPQLNHNQTINVTAEGDGVEYKSSFNKKTYDETPYIVKLGTPTVEVDRATGLVTITPDETNADKVTGYVYSVFNSDKTPIADLTDKPYNPDTDGDLFLHEDGQWIKVKAVGQRRFKDSDFCDYVEFDEDEAATALDTPTMSVDKDGYVTFSATKGSGYTYKIKKVGDADFVEADPVPKAAGNQPLKLTTALEDGAQIMVKANKIATEDKQLDSPWSETPLTYQAPVERTDVPTDFAFTMVENQVKLSFTAANGVSYKISLNGGEPVAVDGGEHSFAIAAYTSISLIVVGNAPAGSLESGDFHTYFKDKTIDLKETYETQFYNAYTELNALNVKNKVISEETITLPATGTNDTNVEFTWEMVGTSDCATLTGNSLAINPANAAAEGSTVTIKVTVTGKTYLTRTFEIKVKTVTETTFDFTAQGYTNQQSVTSINADFVTITFTGSSNPTKYYTDGTALRIYYNNKIEVNSPDRKFESVQFVFGSSDGTNEITCDKGTFATDTWSGNENKVTFSIGGSKGNRRVQKIIVTYSRTDAERVALAKAALPESIKETALTNGENFTAIESSNNATLSWSFSATSGGGTITFADGKGTAKSSETVGEETTGTVTVTITSGSETDTKTYEGVTIAAKSDDPTPPPAGTTTIVEIDFSNRDGMTTSKGVSSYTDTWSVTKSSKTVTFGNFNNNNNYGSNWTYIKAGAKKSSSVAAANTTKSTVSFTKTTEQKITKFTVSLKLATNNTCTAQLIIKDSEGNNVSSETVTLTVNTSDYTKNTINIPNSYQSGSYTYVLEFSVTNNTTSNGGLLLSKLEYFGVAS